MKPWSDITRKAVVSAFVAVLVSGCAISQLTSPFSSRSKKTADAPNVSEERLLEAARTDTTGQVALAQQATGCPDFTVWPRDKMLTVYEIGRVGDGLGILHRGEITKVARECQVSSSRVRIKYGFAGRVLLGPRGQPGPVTLPLKVHVTDSQRNIVSTENTKINVNVPPDTPVGYFSAVKELSFTIKPGVAVGDYQLFIGFDRSHPGAG